MTMSPKALALVGFTVTLLLALSLTTQIAEGALFQARVLYPDGRAAEGAEVSVYNNTSWYNTTTDANGEFTLNIPPGNYTLNITKGKYYLNESVTIMADGTCYVDGERVDVFYLEPVPTKEHAGGGCSEDTEIRKVTPGTLGAPYSLCTIIALSIVLVIIAIALAYAFSRMHGHTVLDHATRRQVLDYINSHPGIHFRGLMDALNIRQGTLSHHLRTLEREEFIKSVREGMYRRYYPAGMKVKAEFHLNLPQQRILLTIKERPGITVSELATSLGMGRKLVYYHVRLLRDAGLIDYEDVGGVLRCYALMPA